MANRRALQAVLLSMIEVPEGRRVLNEEAVTSLMESMKTIELQTPITIRLVTEDGGKKVRYVLAAGGHRLEAARRLGWKTIPAIVWEDWGEREARMAEISENLHRHELSAAERAVQINEWVGLCEAAGQQTQVESPVLSDGRLAGPQHQPAGVRQAARDLGLSLGEAQRARKIGGLAEVAIQTARELGLDDNQSALLDAAKHDTAEAQITSLHAWSERKATRAAARGERKHSPRPRASGGTEMSDADARKLAGEELDGWWETWGDEDFAIDLLEALLVRQGSVRVRE